MGDGLYYLVESPRIEQAASDHTHEGYCHDHGDGHWHHHGAHRHDSAAATKQVRRRDASVSRDISRSQALFEGVQPHDHTTLLLALASAIELSFLEGLAPSEAIRVETSTGLRAIGLPAEWDCANLGPRGPPANDLA